MAIDYKSIGKRIQQKRKELKIKQSVLAESLDVSPGYISQIETARSKISLEMLVNIAEKLNVEPGYIINAASTKSFEYKLMEIDDETKRLSPRDRELVHELMIILNEKRSEREHRKRNYHY